MTDSSVVIKIMDLSIFAPKSSAGGSPSDLAQRDRAGSCCWGLLLLVVIGQYSLMSVACLPVLFAPGRVWKIRIEQNYVYLFIYFILFFPKCFFCSWSKRHNPLTTYSPQLRNQLQRSEFSNCPKTHIPFKDCNLKRKGLRQGGGGALFVLKMESEIRSDISTSTPYRKGNPGSWGVWASKASFVSEWLI